MRTSGSSRYSLDKVRGAHTFKFGTEIRQYPQNQLSANATTATQLTFNPDFTRGPLDNSPTAPRGQSLAALLLGQPTGGSLTVPFATNYAESSKMWGLFFQDDWKATRKLTLNLGLRWQLETPITERYNRSALGFDPNAAQPFETTALANYAKSPTPEIPAAQFSIKGGLTFAGVGGQSRGLYNMDKNNFMPRIGVAYSVDPKTVIRSGFGMYFGSLGAATNVGNGITFFNPNPAVARLHTWQVELRSAVRPWPQVPGRRSFGGEPHHRWMADIACVHLPERAVDRLRQRDHYRKSSRYTAVEGLPGHLSVVQYRYRNTSAGFDPTRTTIGTFQL